MDPLFWKQRWESGQIGFHQSEVEPHLIEYFENLKPSKVFIPLCGKTLDMKWLIDRGWNVIGVEGSALACAAFFNENQIPFTIERDGDFDIYRGDSIAIWCGDFFDLEASAVAGVEWIYDRAATIALPPVLRENYFKHLRLIFAENRPLGGLLITLSYADGAIQGPPFSVRAEEIKRSYQGFFKVTERSSEKIDQAERVEHTFELSLN